MAAIRKKSRFVRSSAGLGDKTDGNVMVGVQMHVFRSLDHAPATLVGQGLRFLLASGSSTTADRLARLGGMVDVEVEVCAALAALHDDPQGWSLLVIDAEGIGLNEARRIAAMARRARALLPVIILSAGVAGQVFPEDPAEPVVLRAPVSGVALRVGVEHALRGRLLRAVA